jgi:hypothetical protein
MDVRKHQSELWCSHFPRPHTIVTTEDVCKHVCVVRFVCVCVYERERERERQSDRETERERERETEKERA